MQNKEALIKVVLLGAIGVGKSSILKRYVNQDFHENEPSSMGAGFLSKRVTYQNKTYRFQIWDTAGQEKYAPLAVMYYRDAQVILLIYDITSKDSFNQLKEWYEEVKSKGPKDIVVAIVGNKIDLNEKEEVSQAEATEFARSIPAFLKLTSAKENIGIDELFTNIIEELDLNIESLTVSRAKIPKGSTLQKNQSVIDNEPDTDKSRPCC